MFFLLHCGLLCRYNTNTWLSTGWFTMLAALDMCEELHVYGMVHENYCE